MRIGLKSYRNDSERGVVRKAGMVEVGWDSHKKTTQRAVRLSAVFTSNGDRGEAHGSYEELP